MLSITSKQCDMIYDILDTMPMTDYVPVKHDAKKILKKEEDCDILAAFLIYCSEYNTNNTSELRKLLTKELEVR